MNSDKLQKLQKVYKELEKYESYLLSKISNSFLNFPEISKNKISDIIDTHSKILINKINPENLKQAKAIKEYIRIAEYMLTEIGIEAPFMYDYVAPIEKRFVLAQGITQNARYLLFKPTIASYQLEKILSESERDYLGIEELQPEELPITEFILSESLIVNNLGQFDMNATIKKELRQKAIRIYLSSIYAIEDLKRYLIVKLTTESNNMPFAIVNPQIANTVCEIAAQEVIILVTRNVYKYINENLTAENAVSIVKKRLIQIALDYITKGDSKLDSAKLGERIFERVYDTLSEITDNDNQFNRQITLEIMRLTFNALSNWVAIPENYFTLRFRNANEEEQISREVSHVLEVHKVGSKSDFDFFETYAISFPTTVKETLNMLATKGIENPEYIRKITDDRL